VWIFGATVRYIWAITYLIGDWLDRVALLVDGPFYIIIEIFPVVYLFLDYYFLTS
jgi:hypothetical protein